MTNVSLTYIYDACIVTSEKDNISANKMPMYFQV